MQKYWLIFKLTILDTLEYRFDFFMHTFKYAFSLLLMAWIWLAIGANNPNLPMKADELMRYYVIAGIVYGISNFHTDTMEFDIKLGQLTKIMLKPISAFGYYLSHHYARGFVETILKVVVMVPLVWGLGFELATSFPRLLLFLLFLPVVLFTAFCLYAVVSWQAFWWQDVWSIRFCLMYLVRFSSGVLIPISFFPSWYQQISWWLPFQHLVFTPIQIYLGQLTLTQGVAGLGILIGWGILFFLLQHWIWLKGSATYDSIGQ